MLVALGMGSNLAGLVPPPPGGDARVATLHWALDAIARRGHVVLRTSSLHATAPREVAGGHDDFLNACALLDVTVSPDALLEDCEGLERAAGRETKGDLAPRCLDLDLLAAWCDTARGLQPLEPIRTARLALPHPRLGRRAFVLAPLCEVAAGLPIPVADGLLTATPEVLLAALEEEADAVRPGPASERFPWP